MTFLRIVQWEKFQHYKLRNPPWIKLYASILDNDDFAFLPDDSKLLYFCLLMFASRRENKIRYELKWLQRKLPVGQTITCDAVCALVDAGFVEFYQDASKDASDGASKMLDQRRGEERRGEERQRNSGRIKKTLSL